MTDTLLIRGMTTQGKKFRPSDWAERLASVLASYGADHREAYSPLVRPVCVEGLPCVLLNKGLADLDPLAYNFILDFARDNELSVSEQSMGEENDQVVICPSKTHA